MSKGKTLSIPQIFFSYTSGNHSNDDGLKCHTVSDFPEFSGQLHIKEFLHWLIQVESFFGDQNLPKRKQVKFVSRKLKGMCMGMVGATTKDAYSIRKGSYSRLGEDEEILEDAVFTN